MNQSKRSRLSWIAMAVFAVVLASILALIYVRTQDHQSDYFENVARLRQLKQLDARWELDVLKSRMGVEMNYDSLVEPLVDLNQLQLELDIELTHRRNSRGGDALSTLTGAFHQAIENKTRLIEYFKSHNSVLRNSLAFLPTAAGDIKYAITKAAGANGALREFSADVADLLLDSMEFSQAPSDGKAAEIQSELDHLGQVIGPLPVNVREAANIFASHVRTVLREQPQVNTLLSAIAAVPTGVSIDALDNILSTEQRAAGVQAQVYRRYLLIFAAALAVLFLYAALSLIRSHAVINRVNRELQGANATLEERVQERTRELKEAQSALFSSARQSGMAEIANNVLHNVGNVLNSVNISAGVIGSRVRDSKSHGLAKAVQLMNEHAADLTDFLTRDVRGKTLPGYLNKLVTALADEKQAITDELGSLIKSIDHIKEIVATQQAYAGTTSIVEPVQIKDLLEDAMRMNAGSIMRHRITVVKDFAEVPVLQLDKHLVLQILVNLIDNAKQAMSSVTDRVHQLTLRMDVAELSGVRRLRVRVEDDGEGIAPENLTRLFAHGFTTRKNGHGFGLHSCALAAKEMRGTVSAFSAGIGKGSMFTLELPFITIETAS